MGNSIEKAKKYLPLLDEVYKEGAKTSILDGDETTVQFDGVNEVKIAKLDMDGLGDFSRNSGYTEGNTSLSFETVKFDKERSQKLHIDRLDNLESLDVAAGKLMGEFLRTKVIPETDAARIAKISQAEGISKKEEELETGTQVVVALRTCANKMDEDEVPEESRILFITPTLHDTILDLDTTKSKEILKRFNTIIKVPQNRMYTKITLNDGSENYGYKKADDGRKVNFLCVEKSAAVTAMIQFLKYFAPDDDQNGDSHVFPYRNNNLYGYVYENKVAGVYCSYRPADDEEEQSA